MHERFLVFKPTVSSAYKICKVAERAVQPNDLIVLKSIIASTMVKRALNVVLIA